MPEPLIRFGTDGWRALAAEEFTLPNVRAVAQATADYFRAHPVPGRARRLVVGYDTRPLGDRFAEATAEVFAGNRFEVLLTDRPTPTPAVSFSIRAARLLGGVVITASHNPFTYNGFKVKPHYAGPAEPEMTRWIERRLFKGPVRRVPLEEGIAGRKIARLDLTPSYLRFLRSYVEWPLLRRARFKVAYDSMHGAGQDLLQKALAGGRPTILPARPPGGGIPSSHRPEPVGEQLRELAALVRKGRCHAGLATDGDADRVGLIGPDGRFVSSQETMSLLLWHLLEDRRWRGMVVTTVAGTNAIDRIVAEYGVPLKRTPVGFKHIARLMRSSEVLFGGEESGGYGFKGFVPERDGLLAGLLILEMMAMRRQGLGEILERMRRRFGRWSYARADLRLERPLDPQRLLRWARRASSRKALPGSGLGFSRIQTVDGAKILFEDGSWLLLRPSGTEPLLRIYAEAGNGPALRRLLKTGQAVGRRLVNG